MAAGEYSTYKLEYILSETRTAYFATIEDLPFEAMWIPKNVVCRDHRIKKWYINLLKEERLKNWKPKEKKERQVRLTEYVTAFSKQ